MNGQAAPLPRVLNAYAQPNTLRSVFQLVVDLAALGGIWGLGLVTQDVAPWMTLALAPIAAGFLARLFIIFHDCGHGSFFASRWANDAVGRMLGVLLLTPYGLWRHTHARHHATAGDLGRRGVGDIDTLTVQEYAALRGLRRLRYRLYRHPAVLFGLGPIYQFGVRHRLPVGLPEPQGAMVRSVLANDLCLAGVLTLAATTVGLGSFLLSVLPSLFGMALIAVWIFFVQHQFESTWWEPSERWRFAEAALRGSAFYDLPALLRWFTGNIGIHHVHHLCPRIPGYRLPEVLRDHPGLAQVNRIGLRESFTCARLALWDERGMRLVSFQEAGKHGTFAPTRLSSRFAGESRGRRSV